MTRPTTLRPGGAVLLALLAVGLAGCSRPATPPPEAFAAEFEPYVHRVGLMAVQDDGRFKTFDTLATSLISNLHGSSRLRADVLKDKSLVAQSPVFTCLDLIFRGRERYYDERLVFIKNAQVRNRLIERLGAAITPAQRDEVKSGYVSMAFLDQPAVAQALTDLSADVMFMQQPIRRIQNAVLAVQTVPQRLFIPPPTGDARAAWLPLGDLMVSVLQAIGKMKAEATSAPASLPAGQPHAAGMAGAPAADPLAGFAELQRRELQMAWSRLMVGWGVSGAEAGEGALALADAFARVRPDIYPSLAQREVESFYVRAGKFTWAWAIYAVAACFLVMAVVRGWPRAGTIGVAFFVLAFALHCAALALRWFVAGRIPIATQFESMLAAGWFSGVIGLVVYTWPRLGQRLASALSRGVTVAAVGGLAVAAGLLAGNFRDQLWMAGRPGLEHWAAGVFVALVVLSLALVLLVAVLPRRELAVAGGAALGGAGDRTPGDERLDGLAPTNPVTGTIILLGSSVACMVALWFGHYRPVEVGLDIRSIAPILNDTLLYIHVNVIILSYALIAMAAVISLLYLSLAASRRLTGRGPVPEDTREILDGATMSLLHVCFIALWAGIVLGAMWADYSWGRPWGWDPKEVFALNTWIVLLILVHVRLKLSPVRKAFWTAVLCVLTCAVMIFNYYWVNYVIPGLHSYA